MENMEMSVVKRGGIVEPLQINKIHKVAAWACEGLNVSQSELETEANLMFFDGIKTSDIHEALIKSASTLISVEFPDYTFAAARLLLQKLYKGVNGGSIEYPTLLLYITKGVYEDRLNKQLLSFNMARLDAAIDPSRDLLFTYLGLQTLVDRYLIRTKQENGNEIIELPQHMWMRVAMGLALREDDPTARAIQFYNVLSKLEFVSSTPTLFNSGTNHSQLSSCYLNTVEDSIDGIFGSMHECANLSKYAGGIGTDWTRIRPAGDEIAGTNGMSSGVVPYLKIFNDTAVAVNQGGRRKGSFSAYLEPWHPDFLDFCDLKKNSGDERRRAHDIFPAAWIPDLFMKRVKENGIWSFFSVRDYPELHELHGKEFERRYEFLEREGKAVKQMPVMDVWKKILTSLFETGHPWITFKDECNRRNPQDHMGVIHSSNLCTEITLNTSDMETAVCNLGSINLARVNGLGVDEGSLHIVVETAVRMLDNVININFYPSNKAKYSNLRHRPIGLGVMGYMEWLVKNGIDWESEEHLEKADNLFELISFLAINASCNLAKERGAYETFKGSKWDRGILPIDTARNKDHRDKLDESDWNDLRQRIKQYGMRNSNLMAIAPTATISNIAGTTPCIEPIYKRAYTEGNMSGSFLVVDPTLRYGRPELCKESFDIDQSWIIRAAAVRQKWIDQSQSVNIFVKAGIKGSQLAEIYMMAWELGLKTTYYLRSQSTNLKVKRVETKEVEEAKEVNFCSISEPDCESCQ